MVDSDLVVTWCRVTGSVLKQQNQTASNSLSYFSTTYAAFHTSYVHTVRKVCKSVQERVFTNNNSSCGQILLLFTALFAHAVIITLTAFTCRGHTFSCRKKFPLAYLCLGFIRNRLEGKQKNCW